MADLKYDNWVKQYPQRYYDEDLTRVVTDAATAAGPVTLNNFVAEMRNIHGKHLANVGGNTTTVKNIIEKIIDLMYSAGMSNVKFDGTGTNVRYIADAGAGNIAGNVGISNIITAFDAANGEMILPNTRENNAAVVSVIDTFDPNLLFLSGRGGTGVGGVNNNAVDIQDPAAGNFAAQVTRFTNNFLQMWFVLERAGSYVPDTAVVPAITSESKFSIEANGNVKIFDKDGKEISTYVNVMPSSENLATCADNRSCSTVTYILSSKNRGQDLAARVLTQIQEDERGTVPGTGGPKEVTDVPTRKHNAVVAAYAVLKRLNWKGKTVDGKKKAYTMAELTKKHRGETALRGDLKLMLDDGTGAGGVPDLHVDQLNADDATWVAAIESGVGTGAGAAAAANNIKPTATGRLVNECIRIVNENPNIFDKRSGILKQNFLSMTEKEEINSRLRGMETTIKLGYPFGRGFSFPGAYGGLMVGGGNEFGDNGSKKLRVVLSSLVSQLNANGRMLANPVKVKFDRKLKELEDLEEEIGKFIVQFGEFNNKYYDKGTGAVSEETMKAAKAKYEEDSKKWTKKTWVVQSALGTIEAKVKEIHSGEVSGKDVEDATFTL